MAGAASRSAETIMASAAWSAYIAQNKE